MKTVATLSGRQYNFDRLRYISGAHEIVRSAEAHPGVQSDQIPEKRRRLQNLYSTLCTSANITEVIKLSLSGQQNKPRILCWHSDSGRWPGRDRTGERIAGETRYLVLDHNRAATLAKHTFATWWGGHASG